MEGKEEEQRTANRLRLTIIQGLFAAAEGYRAKATNNALVPNRVNFSAGTAPLGYGSIGYNQVISCLPRPCRKMIDGGSRPPRSCLCAAAFPHR